MPTIRTRNCSCCGRIYTGTGKQFCSVACRVETTGAEKVRIMQEKNTRFHPEDFDTARLSKMYSEQKMTCAEIGKECGGLSANTIQKIIVAKGFELRVKGELCSIRSKGRKRSKEFIQKHIDWFKTHTHPNLGKHNPTPIRQRDFYNKICPNCKITFKALNWRKKFCSRICQFESSKGVPQLQRRRKPKTCIVCGCGYISKAKKYCSHKCRAVMLKKLYSLDIDRFDTTEIETMYYRQKLSLKDIASAFGIGSEIAMKKVLLAKGIKLRTRAEQASIAMTGLVRGEEFSKKMCETWKKYKHPHLGTHRSQETNRKSVETRCKHNLMKRSDECKQKARITWKNKFLDEKFLYGFSRRFTKRPNNSEKKLHAIIDELRLPYKFVGNFEFWLGGKNPDFLNCDGQKKIIELYGRYWHSEKQAEARKFLFGQYGYQTLFIWDNELKTPEQVKQKLIEFDRGDTHTFI